MSIPDSLRFARNVLHHAGLAPGHTTTSAGENRGISRYLDLDCKTGGALAASVSFARRHTSYSIKEKRRRPGWGRGRRQ